MIRYYQGFYTPKNTKKYLGDADKVIYRSRWELLVFRWCDLNPDIVEWVSEEISILTNKINDAKWKEFKEIYNSGFEGTDEEFLEIPTVLLEEDILIKKPKEIMNDYDYSDYKYISNEEKWTRK